MKTNMSPLTAAILTMVFGLSAAGQTTYKQNSPPATDKFSTGPLTVLLSPSSAEVSVSGRVMTATGFGVRNARVSITDAHGLTWMALTNPFGYYYIATVPAGDTYVVSVFAKRGDFNARVINVADNMSGVNFIAQVDAGDRTDGT